MIGDTVYFYYPNMLMVLRTIDPAQINEIRSRGIAIEVEWSSAHEMHVIAWRTPMNITACGVCKLAILDAPLPLHPARPAHRAHQARPAHSDHSLPKSLPDTPTSDCALPSM